MGRRFRPALHDAIPALGVAEISGRRELRHDAARRRCRATCSATAGSGSTGSFSFRRFSISRQSARAITTTCRTRFICQAIPPSRGITRSCRRNCKKTSPPRFDRRKRSRVGVRASAGQGDRRSARMKCAEIEKSLVKFTGLPADMIGKANLRIGPSVFEAALLEDDRKVIGRFDGRLTGYDPRPFDRQPAFDPASTPTAARTAEPSTHMSAAS